jgi:hypothetical protein
MLRPWTLTLVLAAACAGSSRTAPAPAPSALAGLAAQQVAVLPTYSVRVMPDLDWRVGPADDVRATADADIAAALAERGLDKTWVLPEQLAHSAQLNASYAPDPYKLAEEPLRAPRLAVDARLPEPLASQIRTLVAFFPNARLVLAPVELRLERVSPTAGRGVLRLVLLDARMSNVRWIGDVPSDTAASYGPSISASIAARLAGIVAPRS